MVERHFAWALAQPYSQAGCRITDMPCLTFGAAVQIHLDAVMLPVLIVSCVN